MNSNDKKPKFQWEVCPLKADEYDANSTLFKCAGYSNSGKTMYVDCLACARDNRFNCQNVVPHQHCKNSSHIESMEEIMKESHKYTAKLITLVREGMTYEQDILKLGHKSWQNDIRSLLVPYHEIGNNLTVDVDYHQVENKLKMYALMESISLLELAAWRAAVFTEHHPTGIYEFVEFMRKGWKKHKKEMRRSNLIAIMVRGVLPFLEKP
eukprot:scaffold8752_cov160-Amphora_coffeaeformis.AAC.5